MTKRANTPALDAARAEQQMRDAAPAMLAALKKITQLRQTDMATA